MYVLVINVTMNKNPPKQARLNFFIFLLLAHRTNHHFSNIENDDFINNQNLLKIIHSKVEFKLIAKLKGRKDHYLSILSFWWFISRNEKSS